MEEDPNLLSGRRKFALLFAFLLALSARPALAQGHRPAGFEGGRRAQASRPPQNPQRPANRPKNEGAKPGGEAKKPQGNGRGLAGLPPKWVDRLRDMSPEEQERFMRNNQRFQNLPPQRQSQIRKNLQMWNRLSPTERNAIRDRERIWEQMSPEQRQYVRNVLVPKWQSMPPERRQLINGRLHVLQGMTTQQAADAMKDPQFLRGLSPDEQSMLRDVYSLRNPPLP